jgi:hypothetical protein
MEPAVAEGRDHEPALAEGGVRPGVARTAEGDQAVAVEVRAALRTLPDVVHLEVVCGQAAGLAPPVGAGQDVGSDLAPGLTARCGAAEGQRASRPNPTARRLSNPDAGGEPAGALHKLPVRFCPRGQKRISDSGVTGCLPPDFARTGQHGFATLASSGVSFRILPARAKS